MTGDRREAGRDGREPVRPYLALIGDVVASRELEDRAGVQRRLRGLLAELNRELGVAPPGAAPADGAVPQPAAGADPAEDVADPAEAAADPAYGELPPLAAELAITAGDEVQGLLLRPGAAVDVVARLGDALHPVRIAWGVGAGELETDLQGDVSLLDGPCFHRARGALEQAKKDGAWARVEGLGPAVDRGLSALFRLMGAVREGWTDTQARYVRSVRGRLQKEVAERYDVSPSVVSESLKAARYRDLVEGEGAARALLDLFGSRAEFASDSPRKPNRAPRLPEYLA